jgi:hypothetical protein
VSKNKDKYKRADDNITQEPQNMAEKWDFQNVEGPSQLKQNEQKCVYFIPFHHIHDCFSHKAEIHNKRQLDK